ncbi:unnamed protein product [Caenorhabditis brenneri]
MSDVPEPCLNPTQWVTDAFWFIILYLILIIFGFSAKFLYSEPIPAKGLFSVILVLLYFVYLYQCRKYFLAFLNRGIEHFFEPTEVDISKPTCKICYLNFNRIRRPLILRACGHTVCEECIENINPRGFRRILSCPFCRTLTVLEDQWESLPKNYAIIELYEGR